MTVRWGAFVRVKKKQLVQGAATCDNCGRASVAFRPLDSDESATAAENKLDDINRSLHWYPEAPVAPDFADVPERIASAAREAHATASINAHSASVLMARTVVEASAKSHGVTKGSLYEKIDALRSQDLIRKSSADAAHEIRHLGNDMAHGDLDDLPTAEDVQDVLALMDELLRELFQGPAISARIKQRREGTP